VVKRFRHLSVSLRAASLTMQIFFIPFVEKIKGLKIKSDLNRVEYRFQTFNQNQVNRVNYFPDLSGKKLFLKYWQTKNEIQSGEYFTSAARKRDWRLCQSTNLIMWMFLNLQKEAWNFLNRIKCFPDPRNKTTNQNFLSVQTPPYSLTNWTDQIHVSRIKIIYSNLISRMKSRLHTCCMQTCCQEK